MVASTEVDQLTVEDHPRDHNPGLVSLHFVDQPIYKWGNYITNTNYQPVAKHHWFQGIQFLLVGYLSLLYLPGIKRGNWMSPSFSSKPPFPMVFPWFSHGFPMKTYGNLPFFMWTFDPDSVEIPSWERLVDPFQGLSRLSGNLASKYINLVYRSYISYKPGKKKHLYIVYRPNIYVWMNYIYDMILYIYIWMQHNMLASIDPWSNSVTSK